jgi:hypothetical protein
VEEVESGIFGSESSLPGGDKIMSKANDPIHEVIALPANAVTKAMERTKSLCDESVALEFESWLSKVQGWPNSAALFHSFALATDRQTLLDHLATLRYSLIFGYLGFLVSFEPTGTKGPDLLITRDGISATVEVTRLRPTNPGPPALSEEECQSGEWGLEPYGDPYRDINRSFGKVLGKFKQAIAPHSIIAVWNDDDALEELEMSMAVRDLWHVPGLPAGLDFVIYGSQWISSVHLHLHTFPMKPQLDTVMQAWAQQIESVNVRAAIKYCTP